MKKIVSYCFFAFVLCIAVARQCGWIHVNIAEFRYPDIVTTFYDRDWYGGPYVVREQTNHRFYEDALCETDLQLTPALESIVGRFPYFGFDATLEGSDRILTEGDKLEICINQLVMQIELVEDGWLRKTYNIHMDSDVAVYSYGCEVFIQIHDYAISLDSPVIITGLQSEEYVKQRIQEFYIYRCIYLLKDYYEEWLGLQ